MASINLSGVLRDPLGEVSYGNKIRFTHNTTTGETVKGFRSIETVVINGEYDIDLEYGNVHVETWDKLNDYWVSHGVITINSDTPATSIPALLGITTPATDEDLLVFQALVADAELARDEAVAAKDETEALFDNFDSSVSESLSLIGSDVTFEATFNDSLNISKGYGAHDTITVASETVELPTKSVDFTCASERAFVNKSGSFEVASVDKPAIGGKGLWVHDAYTNMMTGSESYDAWSTTLATKSQDGTIAPGGVSQATLVDVTSSGGFARKGVSGLAINTAYNLSYITKAGTSTNVRLRWTSWIGGTAQDMSAIFTFSSGEFTEYTGGATIDNVHCERLTDGWWRLSIVNVNNDTGNGNLRVDVGIRTGETGSVYVNNLQVEQSASKIPRPYIATSGSAASIAKTISSVYSSNNLPPSNAPFLLEFDGSIVNVNGANTVVINTVSGSANLNVRRDLSSGLVSATLKDSSGSSSIVSFGESDEGVYKWVFRFDGSNIALFRDGVMGAEVACSGSTIDFDNIMIDERANCQIKNLRIHHGYVSNDTIKSWGGAL